MTNSYTIFYADDDRDDREIFQSVISEINEKHDLHIQRNGQELLNALKNPPPHAQMIFLDLNMPVKNGYEVLVEIRANAEMNGVPIIIFSTSDNHESVSRSKKLGANLYITKPDSYERMKKMLSEVLSIDWRNHPPGEEDFVYIAN
ncbi:response regulator [Sediminibacterium soli]|uniref:response regulator n=1 Tax=Sediminibacterium soli TaxID=2698829 RepID=UPI001379AADF|nr:response regulator [Sediminibacterium soli]NCI47246.1 response regulator [Sediminibacterium soli]